MTRKGSFELENFFYSLEQDRSFKRQVKFLREISLTLETKTVVEWQKEIDCSAPTLRGDIAHLNETLSSYLVLTLRSGQVKLTMLNGCSIDIAISHLAKETLSYQIIELLYHCRNWSVQKTLFTLNISRTKFFNTLNHMNQMLKEFNLRIATNPFRFEGSEADIRVFLFHFYTDFSDLTMVESESKVLTQHVKNAVCQSDAPHLYLCYFRLNFWMEIIYVRWRYKQFVSIQEELKEKLIKTIDFLKFKINFQQTNQHADKFASIPQDEWMWLYIVILDFVVYSGESNQDDKRRTFTYRRNEEGDVLTACWQFLSKALPEEMLIDASLDLSKIEAFLLNMQLLNQLTPSFEKIAPKLKSFIKQSHPKSYHFWQNALEEKLCQVTFPFCHTEDIAVGLTLLYQNILMTKKQTKVLVLFAFQGGKGFDDYLINQSKAYVMPGVEVRYFLEHILMEEDVIRTQADLVVCNYYFNLKNQDKYPVLRLSNLPTDEEWNLVQRKIRKLIKQR